MTLWRDPAPLDQPAPLPGLHPLVGQTLNRRGLISAAAARAFLDPRLYSPTAGTALPGLPAAVERLQAAIRARQTICVWGDFDVDGQTSTTLLVSALQALGGDVVYHIPVRARESHGVNTENLARILAESGAKLILTCDTGITAHQAAAFARSQGVDMLITDHHDLPQELPQALAIVNPKFLPPDHPLASLAGVGVAFKLAEALIAASPTAATVPAEALLDLVALGLVADLAILRRDARYLVQAGLLRLRNPQRLGLRVMMELAELDTAQLTEEHIGFVLAPRLNALGRLGDANPAVELLTTSDPVRARVLATQLEGLNAQRKLLCDQVYQAAESQLRADPALLAQPVLVLAHPAWPGGVVGIVASRLVERYRRPAILLCTPPGGPAHGSARSVEGLNITAAIATQQDLLLNFGGHPMAAGLSLDPEKLPDFRRGLNRSVAALLGETPREEAALAIDGWLPLHEAGLELARQIEQLAPFGPGNEKLTLASHNLTLKAAAPLGRNKEHLKLTVEDDQGRSQTVLWWDGGAEELPDAQLGSGAKFDLAYTLRASDWRGAPQAQLEFVAFRLTDEKPVQIAAKPIRVIDYRGSVQPEQILAGLDVPAGAMLWAEGEHKQQIGGVSRQALSQAEILIVWTAPPSQEELRLAVEAVRPETVWLFALDPGRTSVQAFLERLAGLAKYALNRRDGQTSLRELAAATAQTGAAVRLGLDWLAKRGQLHWEPSGDDRLALRGGGSPDEPAAAELLARLQVLLKETSAYRENFQRADAQALFNPES